MYAFNFERAADAKAAVAKLKAEPDAKFLGGGQSLLAAMKLRLASPSTLVDVARIPGMAEIRVEGKEIVIGAAARHADVEANAEVRQRIPALATLAGGIGDRQVRAMGTIGGALANDDPAADYPAGVLGLGATVVTDRRSIAADDFFKGLYETALEADELITAVRFPIPDQAAYAKFANPASRFALVGVLVARTGNAVRVAVTGAADSVFRCQPLEQALSANFTAQAARGVKVDAGRLNSDLHGSAEYRAHLIPVLAARAVEVALKG
ncbi:Carbon monoxide dehydrogenase medium chain (CO dehydrogenase subunit M) (CO-DH M) [Cupriavidus phytorum]|uniref:Carbon monoxide dehydrogenase medium chain (CO dehydrogenase subunit M) (CO-DH M) n=2 Tax=Cupriavidus TaxID=106589 RepID=A0A375BAS8_9BURK|nr:MULTISPECIES: xanthine dehydrogenase family protein subunit M [Cupriavidus]PZX30380.1 carbon-monoxide dehydrogenase medium subunit [Cupriavidus alkaliphilus]SOY40738.1 Carbon monoxide dehydrogenase medium chain (CO dehydrogenase subunit M) (CO-DH M) [Cupriavidus taiwanensis]